MAPHSTPTRTPCPLRASVLPASLPFPFVRAPALPSARIVPQMSDLATKTCVSCRGGVPPLKGEELASLQKQVDGWNVIEEHHITKTFKFPDFREALKFVNRVGELAEEQGHHPDISLAWGKVEITTWTHKINGLTESDFILAAKIDQLYKS
jgi:4a-hydroxytetrahydrobiopterin dehydratase